MAVALDSAREACGEPETAPGSRGAVTRSRSTVSPPRS